MRTYHPPPPARRRRNRFVPSKAAGGGTTFPITPAGSSTPTGALVKAVTKVLAGSSTPAGALVKLVAKPLAGSSAAAGALAKLTAKPLAGSSTPAGTLTRQTGKVLAGSSTPTGALAKAAARVLAGSLTPAGALAKQAGKVLAGSSAGSGSVTRQVGKLDGGASAPSGGLTGQTGKGLSGSTAPAGALVKAVAKPLAGSSTPAGTLATLGVKLLAVGGTLAGIAGAVTRQVGKLLAGSSAPAGALATQSTGTTVPTLTTAAFGWSAVDNGLAYHSAGPRGFYAGEARRLWVDFAGVAELVAGDSIATATAAGGGVSLGAPAVVGTRVYATAYGSPAAGDYRLSFRATTAGGTVLCRSGWVRVPAVTGVAGPGPVGPAVAASGAAPAVLTPAFGWVGADDGLTLATANPRRLVAGEARRVWVDFAPLAEVRAGDALAGLPTATRFVGGPQVGDVAVVGTRVHATLFGAPVPGRHRVRFTCGTAGGSVLCRSGWVDVPTTGTVIPATPGVSPVPTFPAVGWVASDDGLVYAVGGPHRIDPTEARRYWMDFRAVAELAAGDSILGTPTVGFVGGSGTAANIAVGTGAEAKRVYADLSGLTVNTEYRVVFTITTTGGATIIRDGVLRCVYL